MSTYRLRVLLMAVCLLLNACSAVGELTAEKGDTRPFETPLPINTEPKRLALGGDFAVGVKADGTVWSWGTGFKGELGRGKKEVNETPEPIPGMTGFMEVAAGLNHVVALRKDGTVWTWGNNKEGQLGYKEDGLSHYSEPLNHTFYDPYQFTPKQVPGLKDIVSVAAGNVSLALDVRGGVWAWGGDSYIYKAASCANCSKNEPRLVYQNAAIKKMSVYSGTVGLIFADGNAVIFGGDVEGLAEIDYRKRPKIDDDLIYKVPISNIVDMSMTGLTYEVLRSDGTVWALGRNHSGLLGQCDFERDKYKTFVQVKNLNRIKKIQGTMAWDDAGYIWQWGAAVHAKGYKLTSTATKSGGESCPIRTKRQTNLVFFIETNRDRGFGTDDGRIFYIQEPTGQHNLSPVGWMWK